jgi:hypothetical protein
MGAPGVSPLPGQEWRDTTPLHAPLGVPVVREHADPAGLEPGRLSLVGSSITPVALGAKPPQTRRWASALAPASRCGTAHRTAPIHAAAGRAVLHACDPRACSTPCPRGMGQGVPRVEMSLYYKADLNGSRTCWLRLCDHTLTAIETQPLNRGGVALPAIRLQHLLQSGSSAKDHARRHAHQTPSHTRSPPLAHRNDQQATETQPPRGEGHVQHAQPLQTPFPTDPPAVIRVACAAALLGAAAFAWEGSVSSHPCR